VNPSCLGALVARFFVHTLLPHYLLASIRCSTNVNYGKVAAEASRGGKQTKFEPVIGFQWTFLFSILISFTEQQADHFRISEAMGRLLVGLLVTMVFTSPVGALSPINLQGDPYSLAIVRGRAICLDAAGREADPLFGCNEASHRFSFAGKDGKLYRFSATDPMTVMFSDPRVRQRELQVTARLRAGDQLEVIKVQSIKEGKLYDIFYFCEVCNIKAYAPGLCPCCRNDLEFRETLP